MDEDEIQKVEAEPLVNDDAGMTAGIMEHMFKDAAEVSKAAATLDLHRLSRAAEFLQVAEENGFSPKDIVDKLQQAFDIGVKKEDSRALARLAEMMMKTMFQPATDFGKMFIQIQQNNIRMNAGKDKKLLNESSDVSEILNNLPEAVVKKFIAEKMQEMMDE